MHIGGAFEFPFGRVKLTIAHHGSAAPDGTYTGNPCGFLITMDGRTLYHSGDTGLFLDMKLIGEMNTIDVAVLPIGDNFTMGIEDAVKATEFLQPGLVIPIHYKTFDVIDVDPQEFVDRVTAAGFTAKVLEFGGTYEF
jgi:L-ascorbate metabolism protein UlaG (beta-lactamase superfamily)